jgi:hypothetical protein
METKRILTGIILLFASILAVPQFAAAQGVSSQPVTFPTYQPAAQSFTATAQTGAVYTAVGFSSATVAVVGTAITTVTWALQGSTDGVNFFPLATAAPLVPGTTAATQTTTANAIYVANVAGFTKFRIVTSGTFTATGLTIKFTASAAKGLL